MSIELKMCAKRVDELMEQNAELLAALKTLLALHDNDVWVTDPWDTVMEKARVAIAKAEGGL